MALNVGYVMRPRPGEHECGDACVYLSMPDRLLLAVADGLGHGPEAAYAAHAAMQCIHSSAMDGCEALFAKCDRALLGTRGAALAIAIVELVSGRLTFGAVGNIRSLLIRQPRNRRFGSARGIVGAGYGVIGVETVMLSPGDTLAVFTDGLDEFPDLREKVNSLSGDVQQAAQDILNQWARPDDDAAVLLYKHEPHYD